ncbi:hypothetical protein KJ865_13825 [Myxococcota bacterium]|nr:hypothetical protein [Myxococcota bacterium]
MYNLKKVTGTQRHYPWAPVSKILVPIVIMLGLSSPVNTGGAARDYAPRDRRSVPPVEGGTQMVLNQNDQHKLDMTIYSEEFFKNLALTKDAPRVIIPVTDLSEKDQISGSWYTIVHVNEYLKILYNINGTLHSWNGKKLNPLTIGGAGQIFMKWLVGSYIAFQKTRSNGSTYFVPTPTHVVNLMLAKIDDGIPVITSVVEIPCYVDRHTAILEPGYDEKSGTFNMSSYGIELPIEPPTTADVQESLDFIKTELFSNFPFANDRSWAHSLGALIQPFVRPMYTGPSPLLVVDAPVPGTGKTLLTKVIAAAVGGTTRNINYSSNDAETRKQITANLKDHVSIILLDNVTRKVESASLDRALTSRFFTDRVLQSSVQVEMINSAVWMMTTNNARLSRDTKRRSVSIRLDAKTEDPTVGRKFRHHNILKWVEEQRIEIQRHILTIIRYWVEQDGPIADTPYLGSFEDWSEVVGGIVTAAGVEGFLDKKPDLEATSLEDDAARVFSTWWGESAYSKEVTSGELFKEIPGEVKAMMEQKSSAALSRYIRKRRDHVIGGYRIRAKMDPRRNQTVFSIVDLEKQEETISEFVKRYRFRSETTGVSAE